MRSNSTVTMFSKPKPLSSKGEKQKHVRLTLTLQTDEEEIYQDARTKVLNVVRSEQPA